MKKLLLILIAAVFISELQAKPKMPTWITDRTSNAEYYVGIGYALKDKKNTKHYETASQAALKALTEDISVSVKSSTILVDIAMDEQTLSDLSSIVQVRAQNDIEGYEKADSYETKKEYWVYYRLSKRVYAQHQAEKRQKAIGLANEAYKQAVQAESDNNLRLAIVQYAKAMDAIKGYLNENITLEGHNEGLISVAYNSILQIINNLSITVNGPTESIFGKTSTFKFNVTNNGTPVANMPIAIKYSERGLYGIEKATNSNGILTCKIEPVQSRKEEETIIAGIDLNSMLVESNVDFILRQWLLKIPTPNASATFSVSKPSIYITTTESNINQKIKDSEKILLGALTEIFSQKNYTIAKSEKSADCKLEVNTNTSRKSNINGVHTVTLSGKIQLINSSGKAIYTKQLMNIQGTQLSDIKAGMNAYREAAKQLEIRLVQDIENAISKGF